MSGASRYVVVVEQEDNVAGPYEDHHEAREDAERFGELGCPAAVRPLLTGAELHQYLIEKTEQGRVSP